MVIILSDRKNKTENEILEILSKYGANYFSDRKIQIKNNLFTVISIYKKSEIDTTNGIVIILDKGYRFKEQKLPLGIIGIYEETNKTACEIFKRNNNAIISCGSNNKNTITVSSIGKNTILLNIQRVLTDINGKPIFPCELKIKLQNKYSPFSIMASTAVLLNHGIIPDVFWIKIPKIAILFLKVGYFCKKK